MAEYDLTGKFLQHVDRHLGIPMLQFLGGTDLFKESDLAKAQYELARGTDMAEFTNELFQAAYPGEALPESARDAEKVTAAKEKELDAAVGPAIKVIEDPTVLSNLTNDKQRNLRVLEQQHGLSLDNINALYRYGFFQFSSGNYAAASSYLYHFRVFSTDPALTLSTYWGKLAADTLLGNWDDALAELKLLRDQIDSGIGASAAVSADYTNASHLADTLDGVATASSSGQGVNEQLLKKRVWLLHWSLFVYFNHPQGLELLVEHFFSPAYLSAVQTSAPWLLRYLVVALVLTRRTTRVYHVLQAGSTAAGTDRAAITKLFSQNAMRELVKVLQADADRREEELEDPLPVPPSESAAPIGPTDPVLKFILVLFEDFDFEAAQVELTKAEQVVDNDFFLADHKEQFLESARWLISELYCGIYHRVDITDLSKRLNLSPEDGEKWIVNLIRESNVDAKIDLKERMVYMNQPPQAMYNDVIEKTRGYVFRTSAMGQAMDRKVRPQGSAADKNKENKDKPARSAQTQKSSNAISEDIPSTTNDTNSPAPAPAVQA